MSDRARGDMQRTYNVVSSETTCTPLAQPTTITSFARLNAWLPTVDTAFRASHNVSRYYTITRGEIR